jgi:hypothetical protein
VVRAGALREVGGYDESFAVAQDFDLWLRLSEVGRLANLPVPLLRYRLHAGSLGATRRVEQRAAVERALSAYAARVGVVLPERQREKVKSPLAQRAAWARWAWSAGEGATARKHAAAVVRRRPWWVGPWVILWRGRRSP